MLAQQQVIHKVLVSDGCISYQFQSTFSSSPPVRFSRLDCMHIGFLFSMSANSKHLQIFQVNTEFGLPLQLAPGILLFCHHPLTLKT